jgi:N-acetylglucosamine-6-sulfatase
MHWAASPPVFTQPETPETLLLNCPLDGEAYVRIRKSNNSSSWIPRSTLKNLLHGWIKNTAARITGIGILSSFSVLLLGTAALGASSVLGAPAAAAPQPNVVVIMTDDMRLDDLRVLTKTKALIGSGTTFSNSFVTAPLCCPSRASFLTGQYPHNNGVFSDDPPNGGYPALDHTNTLPVWLQAAGYYTSHIGKYLNGYGEDSPPTEVPAGWSDWQGLVDPSTYAMYGYTLNDNGELITYGDADADYQTDVLADRAVQTITEAAQRQPFFLSIAPVPPHRTGIGGPNPAPRHVGAFANAPLPRSPSFNEADVSDKPLFFRNLSLIPPEAVSDITDRNRDRLASLLAVDDLVERVVNALAASGALYNTVLIFTSDNGYFQGEHRLRHPASKGWAYDQASHVPLLIRGGSFPSGVTADQFVANIDLAPTIVQLTGATAGLPMDGRSLSALALHPTLVTARDLLIEIILEAGTYKALRNESFLYVEHGTGEQELYDLRQGSANYDPYQLESRHADTAYNPIKAQLATKLNQLRICTGTSCRSQ